MYYNTLILMHDEQFPILTGGIFMPPRAEDSRVRRTKRLLRQGLTELLQEKSIKKITVRELSERVDINRGTFYLHYKDIYDLVDCLENELFDEFERIVSKFTIADLQTRPHQVFSDVCSFLYANRDLCAALLGDNGDINFVLRLRAFLQEKCMRDAAASFKTANAVEYKYVYAYFESGAVGMMRYWLENPQDGKTPEQVASLIELLFTNGLNCFSDVMRAQSGAAHL